MGRMRYADVVRAVCAGLLVLVAGCRGKAKDQDWQLPDDSKSIAEITGLTESDFPAPAKTPYHGTNKLMSAYTRGYRAGVKWAVRGKKRVPRLTRAGSPERSAKGHGFDDAVTAVLKKYEEQQATP